MRTMIYVLCLAFAMGAIGKTGEKKRPLIPLKIKGIDAKLIEFANPDPDSKPFKFLVFFGRTKVEVVDKAGKKVEQPEKYLIVNAKKLSGRVVQCQIENGGEEPKIPPKTEPPPKRIIISLPKPKE